MAFESDACRVCFGVGVPVLALEIWGFIFDAWDDLEGKDSPDFDSSMLPYFLTAKPDFLEFTVGS